MTTWYQSNAGASEGTVAVGSGGSADGSTPYDVVTIGTNATLTYDTEHALLGTNMAVKVATGVSAVVAYAAWTTSITFNVPLYMSLCLYLPTLPTVVPRILRLRTSTPATQLTVDVWTNGALIVKDSTGTNVAVTTGYLPAAAWCRVEVALLAASATVGQVEVRRFNNAFSSTPDETVTSTANRNTIAATPANAEYGHCIGSANLPAFWMAYPQVSNSEYPAAPPLNSIVLPSPISCTAGIPNLYPGNWPTAATAFEDGIGSWVSLAGITGGETIETADWTVP